MNIKNLFFTVITFVFGFAYSQQTFVLPKNGQTQETKTVFFLWNPNCYSGSYKLQISSDSNFNSRIASISSINNYYTYTFSNFGVYYCRIKGNNETAWSPKVKIELIDLNNDINLASWFDANINIVKTDSAVNQWADRKLISRTATQDNFFAQPILIDSVQSLNNKNVLSFNGNSSLPSSLSFNNPITLNNYSLFIVRNYKNNSNAIQSFLAGFSCGFFSEADVVSVGFGVTSPTDYIASPTAYLDTAYAIYTNTNTNIYKNNIIIPSVVTSNVTPLTNLNTIGTRPDAPILAYQGEIAELLLFDSILNTNKRTSITAYLRNKYAPPVNLGTDTVFGTSFTDTITLNADNRFIRYLWSNGDTTPSTKVISSGTYSVKTTDIFGFESTDEIDVYPYKRLKGVKVNLCPGDSINVNLGLDASYNILWSNGKTSSSIVLKNQGQYTVQITKSGKTIYDTIRVILVSNVDTTPLEYAPNRDANELVKICGGEKIYIKNDSLFESFLWSTGSTVSFGTAFSSGDVYINYIERNGCNLIDTLSVVVAGQAPMANFSVSSICQDATAAFTDLSIPPVGVNINNWKWIFSNGYNSIAQNPTQTFSALGNVSASLKVTTTQGCSDSIYKTFAIFKKPTPSFYNFLSCSGIPTTFVDQSIANAAAISNWSWDFGGLGVSNGVQNPSFKFPTDGVYNVMLKATNTNGCTDTVTIQTTVNASPSSDFSFDSVCGKTPVSFKFLASVASPSFIPDISWGSWDFGDGNIETAIRNPQHIYQTPGTYDVSLFVRSSDQCVDTVTKRIKVFDFPIVDFTVSQTQCTGKEIQFTDISATPDGTPLTKWNWFFSGQATSEAQNPRYTFNEQGNYTVQLTARNAVGCTGTKLRSVAISAPPTPAFTFSPQNGLPPLTVNYFNQSPVNGNYLWDYGDGSPLVEGYNPPVHIYTEKGTYPIKLIATDFRGCTDTLTKLILVDKAFLDGVMASVSIIPNSEFYKIQVSVINNSNVEITALGLSLQLGGGAVIRENWTGSLLPGQTTVYLFTGEIKIGDNGQIPVICASIDNINNNAAEDRTDNNTSCKEVAVGSFDVLSVYPNPAYEVINFGVMLPKEGRVNIRFIDILGQQMYSKDFDGLKGYNSLSISTMQLNAAVYVAEVSYDGQVVRKKFMRKDRK